MTKRIAALLLLLHFSVAYSQTIKTDVLVIGGTPSGVAAAVQCARSKVKTVLVEEDGMITQNADTVKNLSIDKDTKFVSIKKDDDRWDVVVSANKKTETLKPRVVVDATKDGQIVKAAGLKYSKFDLLQNTSQSKEYRTSIATGDDIGIRFDTLTPSHNYPPFPGYTTPIKALVVKGANNLLFIGDLLPEANILSNELALGQGAVVIAAYCAFFKTTTANLKPRIIQGELLDFKGRLLPFADVANDPYWRAIQQICATGLLRGRTNSKQQFVFMPDSIVTTAEIKPVLLEIYSRAFLWFNAAKPGKEFTVGNLLSFISEITLTDPDNMQKSMAKDWKGKFKFTSEFDPERPITRREFAILANQYLNPFGRAVDLDGKIVN